MMPCGWSSSFGASAPWARTTSTSAASRRGYIVPPGAGLQAGTSEAPPPVSDLLASQLGFYFPFELEWDQAMLMFQPVGGMDRIPRALADAIKGRIRYGVEVAGIANTPDGVSVTFTEGDKASAVVADYCVCTIPPMILARIPNDFSPPSRRTSPRCARSRPARSVSSSGAGSGRRTTGSSAASPTRTWTSARSGTRRTGISASVASSSAPTTSSTRPMRSRRMTPKAREARAIEQGRKVHGDAYGTSSSRRSRRRGDGSATARAGGSPGTNGPARSARRTRACLSRRAGCTSPAIT